MDWHALYNRTQERCFENAEQVGILLGHMTNAIIGLQSGDTKADAIRTLERGIALVNERNRPIRELADKIRAEATLSKSEPLP